MKTFFLLLILSFPVSLSAQKISIKDSVILVDNVPYARIEKEGHGLFQERVITVSDLNGKPAIVIKYYTTRTAAAINGGNPKGYVYFADLSFLQSKQKGQLESLTEKTEKVAAKIVKSKLFKDGKIDEEAVDNFILINPVVFTKS